MRYRLRQYRQARDLAEESLSIARELTAAGRARGDNLAANSGESLQLIALSSLTLAADALGDYGVALDSAFQRLALARDRIGRATAGEEGISLLANQGFEQQALNSLGSIYGALGQFERALDYFNQAFHSALARSKELLRPEQPTRRTAEFGAEIRVGNRDQRLGALPHGAV